MLIMLDAPHLPLTDPGEIEALADDLPMAVERGHFQQFVLGFPRRYLQKTPQMEIVRHYLLMDALGDKMVISSLYSQEGLWRLSLFTRDRTHLFSLVSGTLSYFGMDIVNAESFVNTRTFVLEIFSFKDARGYLSGTGQRQQLLYSLENVLEGKRDLESMLKQRWPRVEAITDTAAQVDFDDRCHPSHTRLSLTCEDRFGLLYLASRCISSEGHNIETAYIQTVQQRVRDEFYLTHQGDKLNRRQQQRLERKLVRLDQFASGGDDSFINRDSGISPTLVAPTAKTSG